MKRKIVDFHKDEHGDWLADLECGHAQPVRHRPPWINRPWIITAQGRKNHVGTKLNCKACGSDHAHGEMHEPHK